ncbi:MAG: cyclic nucleotide-binding domain-containing protein [Armatimonadota bacterium]|nr:cyclic nucleotide-binding domain-containing protein [Armatimonadota bacterium]MDR7449936.1 cyclic nucleotide-binding domain-containing protein [Armatimonadota bacterium]MDR7478581.1 cyclic nucleotide-binding domain-containing protein [Armatimonadota bacterium]MDR7489626.1 cyclic nucleotide-binding domain-containing protein [Armatimonadota bacterium]MDR7489919.1 cyclic nucleotide-binding domain-containing protein [Armatimonadota bacterium]
MQAQRPAMDDRIDILAGMALFADLSRAQLEAVAHTFEEEWFSEGQRILRQGLSGAGFYVILDGEVAVRVDGETRATLARGDVFGEVSALLGEPPVADVVALRPLRCLVLAAPEVKGFLLAYPTVMYRMLQVVARRLRHATQWRA